jgi:DNA-binding CsgD family transcriptional regulator
LAIAREVDDRHRIAEFMDNLGNTFEAEGDFDSAARMFAEAVAMWRPLRQVPWLAMALYNLGEAELGRGELHLARRHLSEAIGLSRQLGDRRRLAYEISAAARIAAAEGEAERAVRFEAVARVAAAAIGARSQRRPSGRGALPAHIAARAAELEAAGDTVQVPPLEQVADECLAWLDRPQLATETDSPAAQSIRPAIAQPGADGLTRRERDVVGLLARGLTNRQIAAELVVTEGTAENYVQRVLGKLGFNNRTQVAAWALERGLIEANA